MPLSLSAEQRRALHALGYLFYRMGRLDSAERVFGVLASSSPAGARDRQALAGMAAVRLAQNDPASALRHADGALEGVSVSSRSAFLHLIRAKALWAQGRRDEAKNAAGQYLYLTGEGAR